ncbi:MAG: hypothetical protein E7082_04135 [Bacteroidales bacterium]|nr:hypothetical protein [Bacteroidales bacterium]
MKFLKYFSAALLASLLAACSEEPEMPPVYQFTPNTTILQLKQQYWSTERNYVESVALTNGEPTVVKGRVVSSDESGNIYKSIIIADETAALTIAVNATETYKNYQLGQEVYVDATYLKIGGYNGLMQLGGETTYNGAPSMTFMEADSLASHVHQSGAPDMAIVESLTKTTTIAELNNAKSTTEGLIAWQSQRVRIEGLTFEDAGTEFAPSGNTNRYLKDATGNRINMRCSSYASFAKTKIPSGTGTVTAILSYYGTDWQLLLVDTTDLEGFTWDDSGSTPDDGGSTPDDGAGSQEQPYTVSEVIAMNNPGTTGKWVTGYIVGLMNYIEGTGNVFSNTELTTNSNIVIAETQSDYGTSYVAVQLPAGALRDAINLVDHPEFLGKEVSLCGDLLKYCGIAGVKNTSVAIIDGETYGTAPVAPGEGVTMTKATEITSGGKYAFWTNDKVALPMPTGKNYSWLTVGDAKLNADGTLSTAETNVYTFTETAQGWTIQDSNGVYLYMEGTYNSFQLSGTLNESVGTFFWDVTVNAEGRVEIVNKSNDKMMQYSTQYNSYGAYTDRTTGVLPYLFQPAQ